MPKEAKDIENRKFTQRYTVISEFKDSHSITQLDSSALLEICPNLIRSDEILKFGFSPSDRQRILEGCFSWELPATVDEMTNVWSDFWVVDEEVFRVTIFRNPKPRLIEKSLDKVKIQYSYCSIIRDTSYLRQILSHSTDLADHRWLVSKKPPWYSSDSLDRSDINIDKCNFVSMGNLVGVSKMKIESDYGVGLAYRIVTERLTG